MTWSSWFFLQMRVSAEGTPQWPMVIARKGRLTRTDKFSMNTSLIFVGLTFMTAILYIMRRRVRLGRRKATF